jgi:Recombination endonuclease VII
MEEEVQRLPRRRKPGCECGTCEKCKTRARDRAHYALHPRTLSRAQQDAANARGRARRERFPGLQRHYIYKMDPGEYEQRHAEQNGLCARCGRPETARYRTGKVMTLAVDHCHVTERVRQLLCHVCNRRLGFLEKLDHLRGDIAYLKKHDSPAVAILEEALVTPRFEMNPFI